MLGGGVEGTLSVIRVGSGELEGREGLKVYIELEIATASRGCCSVTICYDTLRGDGECNGS